MSRSLHTRPLELRAASRVRDPFAPRGRGDARRERATRRDLRARGLLPAVERAAAAAPDRLPRVVVQPPRPGHLHAVTTGDVERLLVRLGPPFFYGLREVALVRGAAGTLDLGRFVAVGRVLLFDLPAPPWRLPRAPADAARLARAGAVLSSDERGLVVGWPGDSLRAFVLLDVLLHELGHHLLQHHRGKRLARVARTREHEARADLVAERARRLLGAAR